MNLNVQNRRSQRHKGSFFLALPVMIFGFMSAFCVLGHFVQQRRLALKELEKQQAELHRLHQENFQGSKDLKVVIDKPNARFGRPKDDKTSSIHIHFED